MKRFRMEIDRKNGAVLAIILPARFEKHKITQNSVICSGPFFLKKMFSLKYISPIVAATAAAAAAHHHDHHHDRNHNPNQDNKHMRCT